MKFVTALLISSAVNSLQAVDLPKSGKRCRALSMSGGGALGAYEAGALWGIFNSIPDKTEFEYDVVTGVSAGSLNTLGVAVYPKGQEQAMVDDLTYRWSHLTQGDLLKDWSPFGKVTGLATKTGIWDDSPLYNYLTDFMKTHNNTFHRKWVVSSVNVETGSYMTYNETCPDPAKAAVSSSSIPFVFPNQVWPDGSIVMDGGTVWNTNLISAIQRCREQVDDDSQISVDVIVCSSTKSLDNYVESKTVGNYLRANNIKSVRDSVADIYDVMHAFPKVQYRYYVEPSGKLPGGLSLINPDNSTVTWPCQTMGRKDAAASVALGPGVSFKQKINDVMEQGTLDLEFVQE